jgi:hypothetical protein
MIYAVAKSIAGDLIWRTRGRRGPFAQVFGADGLSVRADALDAATCAILREKLDALIAAKAEGYWADPEGADHRIFRFEQHYPEVKSHIGFDRLVEDVEDYVGRRVSDSYLMANRIDAVVNNTGSGGGLHRDSAYTHQVKVIWYLSDVTPEHGPFAYAKQSASLRSVLFDAKPIGATRLDHVADRFLPHMVRVTGNAGTCLSADTMGMHQGIPIRHGSRYAMTLYTEH